MIFGNSSVMKNETDNRNLASSWCLNNAFEWLIRGQGANFVIWAIGRITQSEPSRLTHWLSYPGGISFLPQNPVYFIPTPASSDEVDGQPWEAAWRARISSSPLSTECPPSENLVTSFRLGKQHYFASLKSSGPFPYSSLSVLFGDSFSVTKAIRWH